MKALGSGVLWRGRSSVRCIFGFVIGPWEYDETIDGTSVKSRYLTVYFGSWVWCTEFVRQLDNGDEI